MTPARQQGNRSRRPILLATSLTPPTVRDQAVPRDRLLERLSGGSGSRLSLVAGPAGFGKTTLLAAWHEVEAARKPVAWLTVDEGHNKPVVLWSYVIEALRRVCPDVGQSVLADLAGAQPIVDVVLPRLVNELADQGEVTLILDDFHRLLGGAVSDSVAWFVDHLPPTFQLVLSTRREPALPLAALRAHGEMLELRADELRFTSEEADALLNGRLALGLAPEDVDVLVERTEGWPTGLSLAALLLRGTADRHGFVSRFGAASRFVTDFLVPEVLEAHPGILTGRLAALGNRPQVPAGNGDQELTSRELVVLKLLTSDLSEREIGRELFVSHSTVHGHVRSIYRKLRVSSRDGALERARELGLMHKSLSPRLRPIPEDAGSPTLNCNPVIQRLVIEPLSVELVPAGHATGSA